MREPLVKLNKKETEEFEGIRNMHEAIDIQLAALTDERAKVVKERNKFWKNIKLLYKEELEGKESLTCIDGAIYEYEEEE